MENIQRVRHGLTVLLCVGLALFAILNVWYPLVPMQERALFALIGLGAFFLATQPGSRLGVAADTVHLLLTILVFGYVVVFWQDLLDRQGNPIQTDIMLGTIGVYLIMVATVRSLGRSLAAVVAVFLLYTFFGQHLPIWLGGHRGYSIDRIFTFLYSNENGILGFAIDASLKYMALFIILGRVLEYSGTLNFITGFARLLFNKGTTGPPLVCVVSSMLIGMVNGSSMGSVYISGQITIPMMKQVGLKAELAAAIEATAANGAQIMPPVMGFAVFFMIVMLDISYAEVIVAAAIPGVLYYLTLGIAVWSRTRRLPPPPDLDKIVGPRPSLREVVLHPSALSFVATAGTLTYLLVERDSLQISAIWAMVVCIAVTMFSRDRYTPKKAFNTLRDSGKEMVEIVVVTLALGLITGPILLTGLGTKLPALMIGWASGDITLLLICAFFACMILGTGMPTSMAYVIVALLITLPITQLGVPKLHAHMFVFYAALAAMITPPVGLTAYAAATIAKADYWETGWLASVLGMVKYLVPFAFVYRPELLMVGTPLDIVWVTAVCTLGMIAMALALDQVDKQSMIGVLRPVPLMAGGFLLAVPPLSSTVIGLGAGLFVVGVVLILPKWRLDRELALSMVKTGKQSS
ncbi:MAG: TRAP transporter fused permease subunit [Alphaproteobacteria bacterium]|nr:TRAP transporter fused permease subunit [Alphaproteobacteria bacterium]